MSLSIRHTGIYVSDLEKMIEFYKSVFGLEIIYRCIEEGPVTDMMFGDSGVRIDVCKLRSDDGCILELIRSLDDAAVLGENKDWNIRDIGISHVAFTVNDAVKVHDCIISNEGKCVSPPQKSADGKVYVFFAKDPEGNCMEIVEELI